MKTKETKILFYSLTQETWKVRNEEKTQEIPFWNVSDTLKYISKLAKKSRFYDLKNEKFCFLDIVAFEDNTCYGFFKSARNEFRPNIINKTTGTERKNPKEKSEGDIEKTHFVISIDTKRNEVFLFF